MICTTKLITKTRGKGEIILERKQKRKFSLIFDSWEIYVTNPSDVAFACAPI